MSFWNEIFGCVNYLNLPYDTVMNMPIHIRKFWIQKHNQQAEERNAESQKENGMSIVDGESLNAYARQEQQK